MISIDKEKCIGCGKCTEDCIWKLISMKEGKASMSSEGCMDCGHCFAICPTCAIHFCAKDEYNVAESITPSTPHELDSQTLLKVIKSRRSIRKYKELPIAKDVLCQIIEAGRYTATAKNMQENHFVCIQDRLDEFKEMIWDYTQEIAKNKPQEFQADLETLNKIIDQRKNGSTDDFLFRNAPCVFIVASDRPLDVGLAEQNIEHMALSLNLGCMYNGYLQRILQSNSTIKEWANIADKSFCGCILLGYPDVTYQRTTPRKPARITWR